MKIYKNIIINTNKYLGLLTLNRQVENNSLDIETSKEIYEGLKELEMNSSVRVILIQGNKKFFSPGADIKELSNLNTESAKSKGLFNFFDKIKEIIISESGYSCGTGDSFVMAHDPWFDYAHVDLVDMEGYALAKVARKFDIPFTCYKYVSDFADENAANTWQENVDKGADYFIKTLK